MKNVLTSCNYNFKIIISLLVFQNLFIWKDLLIIDFVVSVMQIFPGID